MQNKYSKYEFITKSSFPWQILMLLNKKLIKGFESINYYFLNGK
jgi:hypothetical protein